MDATLIDGGVVTYGRELLQRAGYEWVLKDAAMLFITGLLRVVGPVGLWSGDGACVKCGAVGAPFGGKLEVGAVVRRQRRQACMKGVSSRSELASPASREIIRDREQ
jgi:hypothetical protein